MMRWSGSESVLGLELTSSQIKVIEAVPGARLKIVKVATASFFRGDQTAMAGQIRNLLRQEGFKSKVANVTVSGGGSIHALTVLPPFKKGEMRPVVERELRKLAVATGSDLSVGWQVVGQVHENGVAKNQILMVGAPLSAVQQARALLEEAGLKIGLISTLPVALFNAIQLLDLPAAEGALAHLKLGAESSWLAVIRDNMLQFSREIPIGLRSSTAGGSALADRLVAEMKRTALYYRQNFRGEEIRRIVLSGDEADLRLYTGPIMDELGVEVSIFDPTPAVDLTALADGPIRFRETANHFAVPLGLAWRPRSGEAANIAAVPEKVRSFTGFSLGRVAALLVGVLLFSGVGFLWWQVRRSIDLRQQQMVALNTQSQSLQPQLQQAQEETQLREVQKVRQAFLEGMTQQSPVMAKALQEFSLLVPDQMLFRSVRVSKAPGRWQISIDGEVVDQDGPRATAIFNRFLTELRSSSFFYEAGLLQPIQVSSYEDTGSAVAAAGQPGGRNSGPPRAATGTAYSRTESVPGSIAIHVPDRTASSSEPAGAAVRRSRVEFKLGVSIVSL